MQLADAAGAPLVVAVARDAALTTKGRRRTVQDAVVATRTLRGLDLAALSGTVDVALALGDVTVSGPADVQGGGRSRRLP